jgi:hypothetical protein
MTFIGLQSRASRAEEGSATSALKLIADLSRTSLDFRFGPTAEIDKAFNAAAQSVEVDMADAKGPL